VNCHRNVTFWARIRLRIAVARILIFRGRSLAECDAVWVTCAAIGAGTVVIDDLEGEAEADGILRHEDDEQGARDDGGEGRA
jgi:hypothetical protein